jgi:hypothetical protein
MEPGVLDGRQHAERGQHAIGARWNGLGKGAAIVATAIDNENGVFPAGEQARGGTSGRSRAHNHDRRHNAR